MRVQDRIASNSREHWVLYALDAWAERREQEYVEAAELYEATGEKLPSAEWVHEGLHELTTRGLVETKPQGFAVLPPGSTCVKQHGKPEAAPWEREQVHDLAEGDDEGQAPVPEDSLIPDRPWVATDTERVYWGDDGSEGVGHSSMLQVAEALAERLPAYDVVVTCGPWRLYDTAYAVDTTAEAVRLDYYSVRPSVQEYAAEVIQDAHEAVLEQRKWEAGQEVPDDA